jgi:hypothetical protein
MSASLKAYRVRFTESRVYTMDVTALNPMDALDDAKDILAMEGYAPFARVRQDTRSWDVEEVVEADYVRAALRKALSALNTVPRFQVDDSDSYAIAAEIAQLIRNIEGGAR